MGHSPGFLDAEWLAREVFGWLFEDHPLPEGSQSLPKTKRQFELTAYPLNWALAEPSQRHCEAKGGRTVTIRLVPNAATARNGMSSSTSSPGAQAAQAFLNEYSISIHEWVSERIPKPKTYRIEIRKSLKRGKDLFNDNDRRKPFFYRRWSIHVSPKTSLRLLSLQLAVIFTHWKILDLTTGDLDEFRHFCISLFRKPEMFEQAAKEVLFYIFSNWVMPQDPEDFTRYVKQSVWALYNKGAGSIGNTIEGSRGRNNRERNNEGRRSYAQKTRTRKPPGYVSVYELVALSQTGPQRIYEAINAGTLKAQKFGKSLFVTTTSAAAFVLKAQQKREIRERRSKLETLGMSKDANRKRLFRLRENGFKDDEILQQLQRLIEKRSHRNKASPSSKAAKEPMGVTKTVVSSQIL